MFHFCVLVFPLSTALLVDSVNLCDFGRATAFIDCLLFARLAGGAVFIERGRGSIEDRTLRVGVLWSVLTDKERIISKRIKG
jgi:hypothetical protein